MNPLFVFVSSLSRPYTGLCSRRCLSARKSPAISIDYRDPSIDWDDRQSLQNRWTLPNKGWQVDVSWKITQFGVGLFAKQDISAGTLLRRGIPGQNLLRFQTMQDVESFCEQSPARWRYLADYLWGLYYDTDDEGYANDVNSAMFVGMWIPGNGLNHNETPNTVYRFERKMDHDFTGRVSGALHLVALRDISSGDEMYDDYRRHGTAPSWLKSLATERSLQLNFADCNDFVNKSSPQ